MADETKLFRYLVYFAAFVMVSVLCNDYSKDISTTVCERSLLARILKAIAPYIYGLSCYHGYAMNNPLDFSIELVLQVFRLFSGASDKSEELYMCQLDFGRHLKFQFSVEAYHCETTVQEGPEVLGIWMVLSGCVLLAALAAEIFIRRELSEFDSLDDDLAEIRAQEEIAEYGAEVDMDENEADEGTRID